MGRWEQSRAELIQGLRMKVGPLTRMALARACTNLGRFDEAEEQYKLLMEERPADTRGVNGLANLYVRQGKNAGAAELYSKAFEIDPEDADARLGMGLLYQVLASQRKAEGDDEAALGYYRNSVSELERAVEARPAGVPARSALALVYAQVGRFEDALDQSRTALRVDPGSALAHLNLGKVFRIQGDFERAREAFLTVKRLDERGPWGAEANRELGRLGGE
jgi:Flp pilus assembly protein TadD